MFHYGDPLKRLLRRYFPKGSHRGEWLRAAASASERSLSPNRAWAALRASFSQSRQETPREWIAAREPNEHELTAQRRRMARAKPRPVFAFFLLAAEVHEDDVASTLRSLIEQTNPHWEALLVTAPENRAALSRLIADQRVRIVDVPTGSDPLATINAAAADSDADYLGIIDAGDRLAPHALYEAFQTTQQSDIAILYSDEDCFARSGRRYDLRLKPSWSPATLLGRNYIGRMWLAQRKFFLSLGGFSVDAGQSYEWDLFLRMAEALAPTGGRRRIGSPVRRIVRVPRCLYHRKMQNAPLAPSEHETVRIVSRHIRRKGDEPEIVNGFDGVSRPVPSLRQHPLVSVVIPNRDCYGLVRQCVEGVLQAEYPEKEILVVDNDSRDLNLLNWYDRMEATHPMRVIPYLRAFNYSQACNLGAAHAKGELILFLNNDIETLNPDWMTELVRWAACPEIGVAGARLLYPNGRVQHAGVVLAGAGMTAHLFHGWRNGADRLFGSPTDSRDCLAVTGACQMIRAELFDDLGGYDEEYRLCYSDVVLCLDAISRGLRVVCASHAVLKHHECQSRGYDDPREAQDAVRFASLIAKRNLWQDPFLHPDLQLVNGRPTLRDVNKRGLESQLRDQVGRLLVESNAA